MSNYFYMNVEMSISIQIRVVFCIASNLAVEYRERIYSYTLGRLPYYLHELTVVLRFVLEVEMPFYEILDFGGLRYWFWLTANLPTSCLLFHSSCIFLAYLHYCILILT